MSHHTLDRHCPACEEKMTDAHPVISRWWNLIKDEFPDAHVSWVFRNELDQNTFLKMGKTKCKWPNSKHNQIPSRAMDLFKLAPDGRTATWPDPKRFPWFPDIAAYLTAHQAPIEWGGTWKTLGDGDHFQLTEEVP